MSVRAKFYVNQKTEATGYPEKSYLVQMQAVFATKDGGDGNAVEENRIFGQWTPSASLQMTILNKNAADQFEVGKEYYIDFTPAE